MFLAEDMVSSYEDIFRTMSATEAPAPVLLQGSATLSEPTPRSVPESHA